MSKAKTTGTIVLPNFSSLALWRHEISGQLSDGYWENTRPFDHWKFWCLLESKVERDQARVDMAFPAYPMVSYNLAALYGKEIDLGKRMTNLGRMGRACEAGGFELEYDWCCSAEDMPETLDDFMKLSVAPDGAGHVVGATENWKGRVVPDALAKAYYIVLYNVEDMIRDVKSIKEAMLTTRPDKHKAKAT